MKQRTRRKTNRPGLLPVEESNLTREEREFLGNPAFLTEDDADAITILRARKEKGAPLGELLKRYGRLKSR